MSARLIKEWRDLLPASLVTLVIIVLPYAIWSDQVKGFGLLLFGLGCLVLAASTMGNEFYQRTFTWLLTQPIARSALWGEKMAALAAHLAVSLVAIYACLELTCDPLPGLFILSMVLIPLWALCTAPFWTLLTKNGISGVVLSISAPGLMLLLLAGIAETWGWDISEPVLITLLVIYSLACCGLGFLKFRTLELTDGPSRALSLPSVLEPLVSRFARGISGKSPGAFSSLLYKELRLQETNFALTGLFVVAALGSMLLRAVSPEVADATFGASVLVYFLVFPLLAGALAFTEERSWGLAEWQLTLPPSAARQWMVKILVMLSISVVIGFAVPAGFVTGYLSLSELREHQVVPWELLITVGCVQLVLASLAAYTGSFSNNSLRAILFALAIAGALLYSAYLGTFFSTPSVQFHRPFRPMWLWITGLILLLIALHSLTFANWRRSGLRTTTVLAQVLLLCFCVTAATLIIIEW